MRLRNIRGSREAIVSSPFVVQDIETKKGKWNEVFKNNHPIYIEIGMGKGQFITEQAKRNPDINFIGIEKYSSVLLRAIQKREEEDLDNLLFVRMDAVYITDVFAEREISKIYLNFSDPWPKDRHAKRRLTSRQFLERYDNILVPDGTVEFKTDNKNLFLFSLEEIEQTKWELEAYTYNLHRDMKMNKNNIMTEYEQKFSEKGFPIHKLIAYRG